MQVEVIILSSIYVIFVLVFYSALLYLNKGIGKFFYHNILKWHKPTDKREYGGVSFNKSVCKHCGKEIERDRKGNWNTVYERKTEEKEIKVSGNQESN